MEKVKVTDFGPEELRPLAALQLWSRTAVTSLHLFTAMDHFCLGPANLVQV